MWETIRAWLINLTVITVIYTLADMLLPNGGIRKFARLAIGLMVMAAIISPLAGLFNVNIGESFSSAIKNNDTGAFSNGRYDMDKTYKDSAWEVYSRQFQNMNSKDDGGD